MTGNNENKKWIQKNKEIEIQSKILITQYF